MRRIFQDAQNRARRTPANNTTIMPTDKLQRKPGPPYVVACRLVACLGRPLAQTGGQEEYDERWLEYFREGLRLKSESQEDYEEQDEMLDRFLKKLNASGGDESWEVPQEELGDIDLTLQYDPATDGYEPDQPSSPPVQARVAANHLHTNLKFGIPQVFHGSIPSSHGLQVAPPSLPSASASTSPRTPSSLLSATCSSPPGPHGRILSPSLSNDGVNPEVQPARSRTSRKRAVSSSEEKKPKRPRTRE